ncbi:hypothetical protein JCM31271_35950 [Halorubrum trueperi]
MQNHQFPIEMWLRVIMECTKCEDLGPHRVIIGVQYGDTLGGLCESGVFSEQHSYPGNEDSEESRDRVHCPRPAHIEFLSVTCEIEHEDESLLGVDLAGWPPHRFTDRAPISLIDPGLVSNPLGDRAT